MLPLLLLLSNGGDGSAAAPVDWRALEVRLGLQAAADDERPRFGILLRPYYTFSASEGGLGSEDVSGNVFEDLDVWFGQRSAAFSWRVSAEFEDGEATLEDAWARFAPLAGFETMREVALTVGQFRPRVVRSGSLPEDSLLFRSRTFLGAAFDVFDDGFELAARGERWGAVAALLDGENGSDTDHFWSVRGELELYEADLPEREGARNSPNFLVARFGASTFAEVSRSSSDGGGVAFDLALTYGPWSIHTEWAHLQDEFARDVDVFNGYVFSLGDGDPLTFTMGRMLGTEFEAAARYETADDVDDTQALRLGVSWVPTGAPARFQTEVGSVEADSRDFTLVSVGVVIGGSGPTRAFGP